MINRNDHILWLASAWPNRIAPFNGDFVMRQAQATSAFVQIHVIAVIRDATGEVTRSVLQEEKKEGNLSETVIYYYCPDGAISVISRLHSAWLYRRYFRQAIRTLIENSGLPAFVHVHWGMKAGLEALWIRRKWNIPYYVTEHWTGFLPQATDSFDHLPVVIRRTWKRVLYRSAGCQVVSEALAKAMKERFPRLPVTVIPNVVDTSIFHPRDIIFHPYRFIHVSGLDAFKDPGSLLRAFSLVLQIIPDAELQIYGSAKEEIKALAEQLKIGNALTFHHEVPQAELADAMAASAALILYSKYETFGCVLIEANACGVPVIVTDIPVFRERVNDGHNGILVQPGEPSALAEAMLRMIRERNTFQAKLMVKETTERYAYPVVGRQIADSYKKVHE